MYIVSFGNDRDGWKEIGRGNNWSKIVIDYISSKGGTSYYSRQWLDDGVLFIDYGSWTYYFRVDKELEDMTLADIA
jgi:hypothetical protein